MTIKKDQECHKYTEEHKVCVSEVPVGTNTEYKGQENNVMFTFCEKCAQGINTWVPPKRPRKRGHSSS